MTQILVVSQTDNGSQDMTDVPVAFVAEKGFA